VLLPVVDKVRSSTALQHVLAVRYGDWLPAAHAAPACRAAGPVQRCPPM
jgi:long-chain acyl-CoA synthetase